MRNEERRYVLTGELTRNKAPLKFKHLITDDVLQCYDRERDIEFGIKKSKLTEIRDGKLLTTVYIQFPDETAEIIDRKESIIVNW